MWDPTCAHRGAEITQKNHLKTLLLDSFFEEGWDVWARLVGVWVVCRRVFGVYAALLASSTFRPNARSQITNNGGL